MENEHIKKIQVNGKEIILVGTAHVSADSAIEVKSIIEEENPDSICIELDKDRYASLNNPKKWEDTSIVDIIKKKQTLLFLANIILSSYQRKMAKKFNSQVGKEMTEAIALSKEKNINLVLADRSVQTTFKRIWRKHSLSNKIKILATLLASEDDTDIKEEDLQKMMSGDMLEDALKEVAKEFPIVFEVLVDERNKYLAYHIKNAEGQKVVAVVGAAHIPGIINEIEKDIKDVSEFDVIPEKTTSEKVLTWIIPALLIALVVYSFTQSKAVATSQIKTWILSHSILSFIGSVICLAHPVTILVATVISPLTSLYPLTSVGIIAGLVEAAIRKPKVSDFEHVYDDVSSLKGILTNRVTKILLIVLVTTVLNSLATFIGGFDIITNLFKI